MKTLKMMAVGATALLAASTLTSCLGDSDGTTYDVMESVIVKASNGTPYLLGETTGNIYNPTSTSVISALLMSDGSYYKRAVVGIALADGQTVSTAGSTYSITAIYVASTINYKSFNLQGDTLSTDNPFTSLTASNLTPWARYGYVNVPFTINVYSAALSEMNLYVTDAKEDTLYTRLNFNGKAGSTVINDYISFEMPFTSSEFQKYYFDLEPKNDSIVIKVSAPGENNTTLTSTCKYRYSER